MKKQVSVLIVIVLCVISLVIGAAAGALVTFKIAGSMRPAPPYMTEGSVPRGGRPTEGMPEGGGQPGERPASPNGEPLIGEDRAKEIALEKAGLTADEVRFDRVELDRDNGGLRYDVEFRKDLTEYNAEISATDGSVLSWEVETID